MSTIENVGNNQPIQPQKGVKYDKNEFNAALHKEGVKIHKIENDNGYFIEVFDPETQTAYLVCDRDKDGKFDDYRRSEYDKNGDFKAYDDQDFDGTFDRIIDFHFISEEDGSTTVISSFDNDADGKIDFYDHQNSEGNNQ